ncbi:MAG: hypothetical protein PHV56_03810 [Clostridia bacterium]|nr:hypothetical protein [Clostridia bacterium]
MVKALDHAPTLQKVFPFDRIFTLFKDLFVLHSASLGILGDVHSLCLAGDGTPVRTGAYPRNKRICDCKQNILHCDCLRIYSQPDCNSGWDSYRQAYFNGYHLYSFSTTASKYDLPIYCRLHPVSRHDSISMLLTAEEFRFRYPEWSWSKVLLDSAHDAIPIYRFFDKRKVIPLIDLNKRNLGKTTFKNDVSLSDSGVPICKKGSEMRDCGYDYSRCRRKYRCPLVKKGIVTCDSPCSPSPYGRRITPIPSIILACFHSLPAIAMSGRTSTNVGLVLNVLTSERKLTICLKLPDIVLVKCGLPTFLLP